MSNLNLELQEFLIKEVFFSIFFSIQNQNRVLLETTCETLHSLQTLKNMEHKNFAF